MASGFFVLSLITQQSHRSVRLPPGGAGGRRLRGRGGRPQADGNLVTGNLYASKNIDVRNYVRYTEPKR